MYEFSSKLLEFGVSISLSLIAAYIYDLLRGGNSSAPRIVMIIQDPSTANRPRRTSVEALTKPPVEPRDELRRRTWQITFFVLTLFFWWASIQITIGVATLSLDDRLTRLAFNSLLTAALYPFVILLSDTFLSISNRLFGWFDANSVEDWLVARTTVLFPLSLLLSGYTALFYFGASTLAAFLAPFILLITVFRRVRNARAQSKRPPNTCRNCAYQWSPRGHNKSLNCPKCRSTNVSIDYMQRYGRDALMLMGFVGFLVVYIYIL